MTIIYFQAFISRHRILTGWVSFAPAWQDGAQTSFLQIGAILMLTNMAIVISNNTNAGDLSIKTV
ncbi:hypothetical protein [Asticcacaulis benevestitus]|uniref:Uncharacterized protein n=1 Tax=Asticcacaulis benevestitus DSM 16100 = ATCC BAA-896 TaxID=1121022 RepID=V4PWD5_9CAUL|nr:hypothetical protein [Asticcacaulis benevestitus]ESQ92666.1 hypothetical protein ABENE_07550 [Asticcacaulis benevestitus DSM 16100 = ATCC BAA-896]